MAVEDTEGGLSPVPAAKEIEARFLKVEKSVNSSSPSRMDKNTVTGGSKMEACRKYSEICPIEMKVVCCFSLVA